MLSSTPEHRMCRFSSQNLPLGFQDKVMHFPTWVDLKGQDAVPETVHHVVRSRSQYCMESRGEYAAFFLGSFQNRAPRARVSKGDINEGLKDPAISDVFCLKFRCSNRLNFKESYRKSSYFQFEIAMQASGTESHSDIYKQIDRKVLTWSTIRLLGRRGSNYTTMVTLSKRYSQGYSISELCEGGSFNTKVHGTLG